MPNRNTITSFKVYRALHAPGQPVAKFAGNVTGQIRREAQRNSPVNDPLNALHRGGVVGTYKASWYTEKGRGNQHATVRHVGNRANHAVFVELGRSASTKRQAFTWRKMPLGTGSRNARIRRRLPMVYVGYGHGTLRMTHARRGQHVLGDATRKVLGRYGIPFTYENL